MSKIAFMTDREGEREREKRRKGNNTTSALRANSFF